MYNTRYHSIGLKVKEKQESNPGIGNPMDRMGVNSKGLKLNPGNTKGVNLAPSVFSNFLQNPRNFSEKIR